MSTKRIGIKIIRIVLITVFAAAFILDMLTILIVVTNGQDDWGYPLPNNYEISRINSNAIVLNKTVGQSYNGVIDRYIQSFCYNDRYIGIEHLRELINPEEPDELYPELDTAHPEYYLIDSEQDVIYGPYTKDEYVKQMEDLHISKMGEWIPTVPKPEGVK